MPHPLVHMGVAMNFELELVIISPDKTERFYQHRAFE